MVKSVYRSNLRKIAILGWYGDFNVGNDAILLGILASLKSVMPDNDFITFSWHPKLTARRYGVKTFPYYKFFQFVPKVDALLVGGGTLLTDWQLALPLFLFLALAIGWAKVLGNPVMLYAVGAEPFSTRTGRFLARTILNRVDLITVRGNRSKRFLEKLGVSKPIHVTVDLALVLQPLDNGGAKGILKREGISEVGNPRVVVCLRHCNGTEGVKLKHVIAEVCDYLAENFGAEVVFLPMSTSVYDDDRKIMAEALEMMKNRGRVKFITDRLTPQETMIIIGLSSVVVSMRLHPLIFAAATHTPMIALVGRINHFVPQSNNKISEFMEMISRQSWIFNYENLHTNDLLSKIETLLAASQPRNRLTLNVETLKETCFNNSELIEKTILLRIT